jgi:hypothetical protein
VRSKALAAVLLLGVSACATPLAFAPLPSGDPRPRLLIDNWHAQVEQRSTLRGLLRLAVDSADGKISHRSKQLVLLKRPSKLRVEVFGFLNQTLAVLLTDGRRYNVRRAGEERLESGEVYPDWLWVEAGIALLPDEAVGVLLGVPAIDGALIPTDAGQDGDGRIRIDLANAQGVVGQRVKFDRDGHLGEVEYLDAAGKVTWQARFSDYRAVGDMVFAHSIHLDITAGKTHAEVIFRNVELNPNLSADLFRLEMQ